MSLHRTIVIMVSLVHMAGGVASSDVSVLMGVARPLVLEEVLEHGPLFDELEEEAWWAGVDIDDTALRPLTYHMDSSTWQERSSEVMDDDRDQFCRGLFQCAEMRPWAAPPPPPPVPPALTDLVRQIQIQLAAPALASALGMEDELCPLCQWAVMNVTVELPPSQGRTAICNDFYYFIIIH